MSWRSYMHSIVRANMNESAWVGLVNIIAWSFLPRDDEPKGPNLNEESPMIKGGGTNRCDMGLDLSGSWQQGHSATYNTPSRI